MAKTRKICKFRKILQIIFALLSIVLLLLVFYKHKFDSYLNEDEEDYINDRKEATEEKIELPVVQDSWKNIAYKESPEKEKAKSPFPGHRIVHIDLKGAPPKVSYYKEFFPFIKTLGATGVLMEYEDMFPYSIDVSAHNAYTMDDIKDILRFANTTGLEVIPLIQTFGHLEFVLKLDKFKHLREVFKYPQAICPSNNETYSVLLTMIDDIVQAHEGLKYLHIGCDEVYQLGECPSCKEKLTLNEKWNKNKLFLDHLSTVARYVKDHYPSITPLVWDDELRTLTVSELDEWRLGELIEPVVWKYTADVERDLTPQMWSTYSVVFPAVWIASSFKGAQYPDAITNHINLYYENHKSWMKLVGKYSDKITFRGVIITGWQRYDHFSVLCELLPVSIPSLAVNLLYLSTELHNIIDISIEAQGACKCNFNPVQYVNNYEGQCTFPGSKVFETVNRLPRLIYSLQREKDLSPYRGWFTTYNLKHSYSNPSYVESATNYLLQLYTEIKTLEKEINEALLMVYDENTAAEWLATNIEPTKEELRKAIEGRENILMIHSWPKRPLPDKSIKIE